MAVDQKVSKYMRQRGPMRDGGLVVAHRRTVRDLMHLRGWCLSVDDDTLTVGWIKVDSGGTVVAYSDADRGEFDRDLEACQAEHEAYSHKEGRL
jgi:hypothetical protein